MNDSTPNPAGEPDSPPPPAAATGDDGDARASGLLRALQRNTRFPPGRGALAPWEMLLDPRLESHQAVAALRDWSRVQYRLEQLSAASDPATLFADLQELARLPELVGPAIRAWLRSLPMPPTHPAHTPINLHLARCILTTGIGRAVLENTRLKSPVGPTALFDALLLLEQVHDARFDPLPLRRRLDEQANLIRLAMQAQPGGDQPTLSLASWLQAFGPAAVATGLEGKVNALNRYDACLGSGYLKNGMALPITLCALVQYVLLRVADGRRPLQVRGLNTPGHFLLLIEDGQEQYLADPFRGLYTLSWKTLIQQTGARELAHLAPEALVLDRPADILPRMALNAIKRLESYPENLRSAEYCTLHYELTHDPNLLLQRALLRLRSRAVQLARQDLQVVMLEDNEAIAKLATKFMMREDFYLSQHPN